MILIVFLALTGFGLVFLEFFLPGMIFGVAGAVALLTSAGLFFLSHSAIGGVFYLFSLLVVLVGICKGCLWWIHKTRRRDEFYLNNNQEGYVATQFDRTAIGKEGVVLTELKPAGHVLIDGKQQQALCQIGYLPKGATIHVVGGKGGHLIVKQKE